MSWNRDEDQRDEDEDDQDELGENDYKAQKDAVLFAIEVSKSMLAPVDDGSKDKHSAVMAALKSASQLMQQRIIAQPKDMMGILLFGTEKSKFRDQVGGKSAYPHCYLHTDLDVPSAEVVKALKDMADNGEDPDGILTTTEEGFSMANMLFCANQIFTTNAPNFGSRRLFIVTDDDDPEKGDKDRRQGAAVRAKDLFDLGVTIELFPISREGHKFDLDKFYTDIIYHDPLAAADPENPGEIKTVQSGDGLTLLNSLISSINAKQTPKRAYFSKMPFHIAPDLAISINGYLIIHRQEPARSCYIWLEGDKPQILLKGEVIKTESSSMRTVEKAEVVKAYKFGSGGDYVKFTPDELKTIRRFGEGKKTLRIIGFKPRSMLPPWAAVKKSAFIFPTEAGFVGSTRVFSALWRKLLDSDKMAIAWYISRQNAVPQIVAILPSKSPSGEGSGIGYLPAGLWLYPLPFVDDVRDLEPIKHKSVVKASDELIDQMRTIVQNLTMPKGIYDPSKYPNPALQWHYKVLQNLALDEELEKETREDLTLPKYKQINKRVGGYQVELQERIKVEAAAVQQELAIKREAEEEAEDRPTKRAKAAPKRAAAPPGGMSLAELREAVDSDLLRKKTVADLKAICTEKGLQTTSKKKADLLETIEEWVESQA